jgi:hypothetical protein
VNVRVVTLPTESRPRRTPMGDTVTTRFRTSPAGELVEDITLEVLPPKDYNKAGRSWPVQATEDRLSRVRPVSGDTVLW